MNDLELVKKDLDVFKRELENLKLSFYKGDREAFNKSVATVSEFQEFISYPYIMQKGWEFLYKSEGYYFYANKELKLISDALPSVIYEIFCQDCYTLDMYDLVNHDFYFIDFGANIGHASLYMANKYKNCKKVFAFEPVKETYELLNKNLALNSNLSNNIKTFNYGASDKDEKVSFIVGGEQNASSTRMLYEPDFNDATNRYNSVEEVILKDTSDVMATILKDRKHEKLVLKMDIQHGEYAVLQRMEDLDLLKEIDAILIEFHDGYKGFDTVLSKYFNFEKISYIVDRHSDKCFTIRGQKK